MNSNDELIDYLKEIGILYDEDVEKAMRRVDRIAFVPKIYADSAYKDIPLPIGFNQTISAPHMVVIMSQHLDVRPRMKILEIGAGSGYQAAILSELVGPEGEVYTIERVPELVAEAKRKLRVYANIQIFLGNGIEGLKEYSPYDRILVTCAARKTPLALEQQLKEGGKIVIPIGHGAAQRLTLIEKISGRMKSIDLNCSCMFVPLIE